MVVTPYLCGKKCALTINHTQVMENGVFPVLFDGSGDSGSFGTRLPDDLFANCQADGGDICFSANSDGTGRLNVEIVGGTIDTAGKKCEIWVNPTLSTLVDTTIYVFYKSNFGTLTQPAASAAFGSQGVWDAYYVAVYHMNEASNAQCLDSTSNGYNSVTNLSTQSAAIIGNGQTFASAFGQKIVCPVITQLNGATHAGLSAWMKKDGGSGQLMAFGRGDFYTQNYFGIEAYSDGFMKLWLQNGSFNGFMQYANALATWQKLDLTYDGTQVTESNRAKTYANAALQVVSDDGAISTSLGTDTTGFFMGTVISTYCNGDIDEVRVTAGITRSANYVATDYNIQTSTSFVTVGTPAVTTSATIAVGSGLRQAVFVISNYTVNLGDFTVFGDAAGGGFTISLPAVSMCQNKIFNIKKVDTTVNAVVVSANGSTIDGQNSVSLTVQNQLVCVQSNGTSWELL